MSEDLDNKLELLREEYKKSLPGKINEVIIIWKNVLDNPGTESLNLFHRIVHNLHGSAGIYGYPSLSDVASHLESLINTFIEDPKLINENKNTVITLLKELQSILLKEVSNAPIINVKTQLTKSSLIYILDNDKNWIIQLTAEMNTFGYTLLSFTDKTQLIEKIHKECPAVFIININLIDEQLQNELTLVNKNMVPPIPIIITAQTGEFTLRLKAVRAGGMAYLIKPCTAEDLINKIDLFLQKDIQPIRVLIIDDEVEVATFNSLTLEQENMKTRILTKSIDVDRALHEFEPDAILVDLHMPECNGLELASIIRQQKLYNSIPIIYLSSEEDKVKQLNALQSGAEIFVTKSTKPIYLVMIIKSVVERYKTLRSLMVRDNLTGLYNYSFILRQAELLLRDAKRDHQSFSIALISLDKLKRINEMYGHQTGDQVVISLSLLLSKRLNESNFIGFYHGKQFLVILPNTAKDLAITTMDNVRKQFITLNYLYNQQIFNATFSASIASYPDFPTIDMLIDAVEKSLEALQKKSSNTVHGVDLKKATSNI